MVHGQTRMICWGGLTFRVWGVVVPLPQLDLGNLGQEGVQWQYRQGSVSLAVEPLEFVTTCPGALGLEAGPSVGDLDRLLRCPTIWWTLRRLHFCHHWVPDPYRHPASIMKSEKLVIRNTMHNARWKANIWWTTDIGSILECQCSLTVCFSIVLWIVIPHLAGHRIHLG